jgi:RimJ/RimL family protein N-acetyltransferase
MTHVWPLFDLAVQTPRLELRYATDDLLEQLTALSGDVIAPGTRPFDGDATFYEASPMRERRWLAGQWQARSRASPEWWCLVFAIMVDGRPVGTQEMTAGSFSALRSIDTFSWLNRGYQGRGFGKEARSAVLHLAFAGLGARRATSEAFADNAASLGVSQALGYRADGTTWALRRGEAAPMTRLVLTREEWRVRQRSDIEIRGLERTLEFLGLHVG